MTIADLISPGPQKVEILTAPEVGPPEQLIVDLASSEQHSRTLALTDAPVEGGADITDHVREQPKSISMSCLLSNSFLDLADEGGRILEEGPFSSTKAKDAWEKLERFMNQRIPLTVVTDLQVYENMIITSLTANISAASGDSIPFDMTAREVFFADTGFVFIEELPEPEPPKQAKAEQGQKATEFVGPPAPQAEVSVLKSTGLLKKAGNIAQDAADGLARAAGFNPRTASP